MPIARDDVAHLARLSRLALAEDELDHLAAQLDVIIAAVARVQEDRRGHPADVACGSPGQRLPRGHGGAVPGRGDSAQPGARRRAAAVPGTADPGGGLSNG